MNPAAVVSCSLCYCVQEKTAWIKDKRSSHGIRRKALEEETATFKSVRLIYHVDKDLKSLYLNKEVLIDKIFKLILVYTMESLS